jgi:UDP-N-acetylglucosamine:LPS N-acetylglucosamine transferase
MRVLLACSTGGHLTQLYALKPWWSQHDRRWVTFDKPDARSLLPDESIAWAFHPTTRNLPNLIRNAGVAAKELLRFRPDVVVSTGAAVAVPLFYLAWLLRIRTVYVEVYDRIDSATLTGRLCRPVSDLFLVQWEEQLKIYPTATVIGHLL